jgi:hypothetical protein
MPTPNNGWRRGSAACTHRLRCSSAHLPTIFARRAKRHTFKCPCSRRAAGRPPWGRLASCWFAANAAQSGQALRFAVLFDMAARVTAIGAQPPLLSKIEHFGENTKCPVRLRRRGATAVGLLDRCFDAHRRYRATRDGAIVSPGRAGNRLRRRSAALTCRRGQFKLARRQEPPDFVCVRT